MPLDLHVLSVVEALYGVLDRSPVAVLLLDEHRRIIYANDHAATLDQRGDGVSVAPGGLALKGRNDQARLQQLIGRALNGGSEAVGMRVERAPGKRPYGLMVTPLPRRHALLSALRPAVCVVITDPGSDPLIPVERLRAVFGLTEAEGRLAALLASGEDLRATADKLGITYGTARARLAEIFEKTETRRQGELINLLLTTLGGP
jgi:DNA-binding CsgD family transcriptional regulator